MEVVAGMNYEMTIKVNIGEMCLGAFEVTVWDQFGDLQVTKWGKEITCKDISEESKQEDEESL